MNSLRPAVFLDRDGVVNALVERDGGKFSPRRSEDFHLFPWTGEALGLLSAHEYLLVVVTNQPDISRGHMSIEDLTAMHSILRQEAPIDAIYMCPHDSSDKCRCRKPMPGMFLQAAEELGIDLSMSWTIGDRESDLSAGRSAGTRLIHVTSGQESHIRIDNVVSVENLLMASHFVLKMTPHL